MKDHGWWCCVNDRVVMFLLHTWNCRVYGNTAISNGNCILFFVISLSYLRHTFVIFAWYVICSFLYVRERPRQTMLRRWLCYYVIAPQWNCRIYENTLISNGNCILFFVISSSYLRHTFVIFARYVICSFLYLCEGPRLTMLRRWLCCYVIAPHTQTDAYFPLIS